MSIEFYPEEDLKKDLSASLEKKIEILLKSAKRYKAIVLDPNQGVSPSSVPAELKIAYNWDGIAYVLREVRQMTEETPDDKRRKGEYLMKLAEVYEVLRGAKMQKLEAVRLALANEANQLRGGT